jgi:hypothetical protein
LKNEIATKGTGVMGGGEADARLLSGMAEDPS